MNVLLLLFGFFLPTLGFVTADHLIKQAGFAELFDSIITSLTFTVVFGIGVRVGSGWSERSEWRGGNFPRGFLAGLATQVVVWCFWLMLPHPVRYSFGSWPLIGHLVLVGGAGLALPRFARRANRTE